MGKLYTVNWVGSYNSPMGEDHTRYTAKPEFESLSKGRGSNNRGHYKAYLWPQSKNYTILLFPLYVLVRILQRDGISEVYTYVCVGFKELSHVIMEAGMSKVWYSSQKVIPLKTGRSLCCSSSSRALCWKNPLMLGKGQSFCSIQVFSCLDEAHHIMDGSIKVHQFKC